MYKHRGQIAVIMGAWVWFSFCNCCENRFLWALYRDDIECSLKSVMSKTILKDLSQTRVISIITNLFNSH